MEASTPLRYVADAHGGTSSPWAAYLRHPEEAGVDVEIRVVSVRSGGVGPACVHGAVAEDRDSVVAVVAALLDHGEASAHRLPDPQEHRLVDRWELLAE